MKPYVPITKLQHSCYKALLSSMRMCIFYIFMDISMSLLPSFPFGPSWIILKQISEPQTSCHFIGDILNAT